MFNSLCQADCPLLSLLISFAAGSGKSVKRGLKVHPDLPYVSAVVKQGGAPDFILAVTQLRLCNGDKWHKRIRVCGELTSTNTTHMILGSQSHSVQGRNCSFGYFQFQLKREQKIDPSPDSCCCQPKSEQCRVHYMHKCLQEQHSMQAGSLVPLWVGCVVMCS